MIPSFLLWWQLLSSVIFLFSLPVSHSLWDLVGELFVPQKIEPRPSTVKAPSSNHWSTVGDFSTAVLLGISTSLKLVQLKPQDYFPIVGKREVLLLDRQICKAWNWYKHFAVRREVSLRTEPRPVREQKWRQSLIKSPEPDQMTLFLRFITEPIKSIYCLNHFELDFFFFYHFHKKAF